jgi:hypothetical protein
LKYIGKSIKFFSKIAENLSGTFSDLGERLSSNSLDRKLEPRLIFENNMHLSNIIENNNRIIRKRKRFIKLYFTTGSC